MCPILLALSPLLAGDERGLTCSASAVATYGFNGASLQDFGGFGSFVAASTGVGPGVLQKLVRSLDAGAFYPPDLTPGTPPQSLSTITWDAPTTSGGGTTFPNYNGGIVQFYAQGSWGGRACCRARYRCSGISTTNFAWYTTFLWANNTQTGTATSPVAQAGFGALCTDAAVSSWQELVWSGSTTDALALGSGTYLGCVVARTSTTASADVRVWWDAVTVGNEVV
jgi:hypothetical protein